LRPADSGVLIANEPMIRRIVSGGQTGADRAALDAARALGVETGGWVPRGRWAEDGRVPERYPSMKETDSSEPAERTECNVRDSDGTVVFSHGELSGGTRWTVEVSGRLHKPLLWLDLSTQPVETAAVRLLEWTAAEGIEVLNVAGPRASEDAGIHRAVRAVLDVALRGTVHEPLRADGTVIGSMDDRHAARAGLPRRTHMSEEEPDK